MAVEYLGEENVTTAKTPEQPVKRGRKPKEPDEAPPEQLPIHIYTVKLDIQRLAGGFPGSIDKLNSFLQTPALARRVPAEARQEFLDRESVFDSSTDDGSNAPQDSYVRTGFRMIDGNYFLAAHQIKAMLQGAAEALYDDTSRPSIRQMKNAIKRCVEVSPEAIRLEISREPYKTQIHQIVKHPRYGFPVPINRERDTIPEATVEFRVTVLESKVGGRVGHQVLTNLFYSGGQFVGLGTDRGYGHGRFQVLDLAEVK